jgi:hypothetical protein
MYFKETGIQLSKIIESNVDTVAKYWLAEKIDATIQSKSTKDFYLTYSLIASKITLDNDFDISEVTDDLKEYIQTQNGNIQQIARMYLLIKVLEADDDFFSQKVANIIEVADTGELEAFLKFLILLPNAEKYKMVAVDALRTNISTVFNALAYNNPYPGINFDNQQWNQMFLKTAFMQGDLSAISDIDKRANKDLARIISDYAHERWAAGRDIDPDFWRPVAKFISTELLEDMARLLKSENTIENRAGALCCYYSENKDAKNLLNKHPKLIQQIENTTLSWATLKEE